MSVDRCRPLLRHRTAAFRRLAALIVACVGAAARTGRRQVKIEQTHWGFDGQAAASHFTPCRSKSATPPPNRSKSTSFSAARPESPIRSTRRCSKFSWPRSARWVQFYPYMTVSTSSCRLKLGDETIEIPSPRFNRFQARAARRRDEPLLRVVAGQVVAGSALPPFVTATDGLQAVFLDHVPKWEEGRRTAFLEWLWLGGRLLSDPRRGRTFSAVFGGAGVSEFCAARRVLARHRTDSPARDRRGGLNRTVLRSLFKDLPGDRPAPRRFGRRDRRKRPDRNPAAASTKPRT